MIHVISTSANISKNYDSRKQQYLQGISSIINCYGINPYVIETCNKTDYLSEHYRGNSNYSTNKGINEFININNFLKTIDNILDDTDDIIKTTLRYPIMSSYFLDYIKNNTYDIYCKSSADIYGVGDIGVHTFLFSMKYRCWKEFFVTVFDKASQDPIEWQIAAYAKTKNTSYMDRLDMLAMPDSLGNIFRV